MQDQLHPSAIYIELESWHTESCHDPAVVVGSGGRRPSAQLLRIHREDNPSEAPMLCGR